MDHSSYPHFQKRNQINMHFSTSLLIFLVTVFLVRHANAESFIDTLLCRPIVPAIEEALKGKCACKGSLKFRPFGFNIDATCSVDVNGQQGTLSADVSGGKAIIGMIVNANLNGITKQLAFRMSYERKLFTWTPSGCEITLDGTPCTSCTVGDGGFPWPGFTCSCSNVVSQYTGDCSEFQ